MGNIVSKITDSVGLTDYKGAERDRKYASQQAGLANDRADEEVRFQREQYGDWKRVYGSLQDNLGDYYNNLSADDLATTGLQAQQTEYQQFRQEFDKQAAQRGVADSKFIESQQLQMGAGNAMERARIRAQAPEQVAQQQLGFLGVGLGQGGQMLGINAQASATAVGAATNASNMFAGISKNTYSQSMATTRQMMSSGTELLK